MKYREANSDNEGRLKKLEEKIPSGVPSEEMLANKPALISVIKDQLRSYKRRYNLERKVMRCWATKPAPISVIVEK